MSEKRKRHSAEFKAKVAVEAIRGIKTVGQLASEYRVHPVQISQWKRQALQALPEAFNGAGARPRPTEDELTAPLYEEIGRLKVELDWLKKNALTLKRG